MIEQQTPGSAPALDASTSLAVERTRAAYERTMMAWIRTATSLITFGFTVYKFFQIEAPPPGRPNRLIGPRGFAIILVSIGLFSLILGTIEYHQDMRTLVAQYAGKRRSLAALVAALISILGVIALVVIMFRQ